MGADLTAIRTLLDDLAVKIMMVEPGDLSAVGDLLENSEAILADPQVGEVPLLAAMVTTFKDVLGAIIMAELSDSQTIYDHLAKTISLMQEICRDPSVADRVGADFVDQIQATGYELDASAFGEEMVAQRVMVVRQTMVRWICVFWRMRNFCPPFLKNHLSI